MSTKMTATRRQERRRWNRSLAVWIVAACSTPALAQTALDPEEFARLRRAYAAQLAERADLAATPALPEPALFLGVAQLAGPEPLAIGDGLRSSHVPLYTGLQPSGNGFWSYGQRVYWALDDGRMGPAAYAAGGGRVTEIEFVFGLRADFPGDTLQPYVIIAFYNAPPDPVADATNPVVEPPAPMQAIAFPFNPITLPTAGEHTVSSGVIDLASANLDFHLDKTYYVEILPMEWDSFENIPVFDPDVHAAFTGPGTVTYGTNQDVLWSDVFITEPGLTMVPGNGDFLYQNPAERDPGGDPSFLNQSGLNLAGFECDPSSQLVLTMAPVPACVPPGHPVQVTLSQTCLPQLVRGYQAFLGFSSLDFTSGTYLGPNPYALPVLDPMVEGTGTLDLAAGIDNFIGQPLTSSTANLAILNFVTTDDGLAQVTFRPHDPPTRFTDQFGQEVPAGLIATGTFCVDGTDPVITCPPDPTPTCTNGLPSIALDLATFESQGGSASDAGCGSGIVFEFVSQTVSPNNGCTGGPRTIQRTYRATDCAGNDAECVQTITLDDTIAPVVTPPPNITVSSEAGECLASVDPGMATAEDNCDPDPAISFSRSDGKPNLSDPFEEADSPITITWFATDCAGEVGQAEQTVTVLDTNEVVVHVALDGVDTNAFTRCLTLEFWNCPGGAPAYATTSEFAFTNGFATAVVNVPCGAYSCVKVGDALHTLRRTLSAPDFTISGTQYVADFVAAGKPLTSGNLNGDPFVDITDFGVFTAQYLVSLDPDTTCSSTGPHSDFNGDGQVDAADFQFIAVNFLKGNEPNCCGAMGLRADGAGAQPRTTISVAELESLGLGHLAAADLDRNGVLDEMDIAAFMTGARPGRVTPEAVTRPGVAEKPRLQSRGGGN
jgi:hypothetical protein